MREYFRTILTNEPLEWQLTNTQRTALGLALVEAHWTYMEVPCGLLADCETYAYMDGRRQLMDKPLPGCMTTQDFAAWLDREVR